MCKHFTVWPKVENDIDNKLIAYMIGDGLRYAARYGNNVHGTGLGMVQDDEVRICKSGEQAKAWTTSDAFYKILDTFEFVQPIIGHVRRASVKVANDEYPDEDAHPFHVGDLLLAHNGTIVNYEDVVKANKLSTGCIDSYAIAEMISELEYPYTVESLNSVTSQLEGTFALVFINAKDKNTIYTCRHGKPLFTVDVDETIGILCTDISDIEEILRNTENAARTFCNREFWQRFDSKSIEEDKWFKISGGDIVEMGDLLYKEPPPKQVVESKKAIVPSTKAGALYQIWQMVDAYVEMSLAMSPEQFVNFYRAVLSIKDDEPLQVALVKNVAGFIDKVMIQDDNVKLLEDYFNTKVVKLSENKHYLAQE